VVGPACRTGSGTAFRLNRYDSGMANTYAASELNTSVAKAYEDTLVPGLMSPWAQTIVDHAHIRDGMRVLDVACGTGVAARCAARLSGPSGGVVGIDVDLGMLAVAQAESKREGLPVEYLHGSACALPLDTASFDAALCLQGLQYFPDALVAMRELRRILRPNSPLVAVTWSTLESCKGQSAMVTALERRGIDAAAARKPFSMADSATLEALAVEAGLERVAVRRQTRLARFASAASFVDAMRRGAPSTRIALDQVPSAEWPGFVIEVERALAEWAGETHLEFPVECNVLVAQR